MTGYKYNHIIPKFQQHLFADTDDCIKSYDVKNQKYQLCNNSVNIKVNLCLTATEINFWKNKGLNPKEMEDKLGQHETKFSDLSKSIIEGNNECDQKIIIDWILSRKIFDSYRINSILYKLQEHCDSLIFTEIDNMRCNNIQDNIAQKFLENASSIIAPSKTCGYDAIMRVIEKCRMAYYRRPVWGIIRIDEPRFITSDKSIADIYDINDHCNYVIPINPKIAIIIGDYILPFDIKKITHETINFINLVNNDLKISAQHYWIHNKNYDICLNGNDNFIQKFMLNINEKIQKCDSRRNIKEFIIDELENYKKSNLCKDIEDINFIINQVNNFIK